MAADFLPNLQHELTRSISLIRKAHDEYVAAYQVALRAQDKDQQYRIAQIGHAIADAINATQGCLYEVTNAIRTDGQQGPTPTHEARRG